MFSKILFWYSFSFHISLWASFHVFMAIQISSVKNLLTFFLPNFKLSCVVILSFKMFLYILDTILLLDIYIVTILPQSVS